MKRIINMVKKVRNFLNGTGANSAVQIGGAMVVGTLKERGITLVRVGNSGERSPSYKVGRIK